MPWRGGGSRASARTIDFITFFSFLILPYFSSLLFHSSYFPSLFGHESCFIVWNDLRVLYHTLFFKDGSFHEKDTSSPPLSIEVSDASHQKIVALLII